MKIREKGMNIEKISLEFKNMMSKGNVNGALKLLTENMSNGMLPLTDKTLKMLKQNLKLICPLLHTYPTVTCVLLDCL